MFGVCVYSYYLTTKREGSFPTLQNYHQQQQLIIIVLFFFLRSGDNSYSPAHTRNTRKGGKEKRSFFKRERERERERERGEIGYIE